MKRHLLNLLTPLSLALFVVVAALWVRSYFVYEHVGRITPDHGARIVRSASGRLHFARHSWWDHTFSMTGEWEHHRGVQASDDWPQREYQRPEDETLGFAHYVGTAYSWPGHIYPNVNPLVTPRSDPRWWRDNYNAWVVPHWALATLTGALPAWWLRRHPPRTWESPPARRRRARGLCPRCGYDLRATPERCPECGAVPRGAQAGQRPRG